MICPEGYLTFWMAKKKTHFARVKIIGFQVWLEMSDVPSGKLT